MGNQANFSRMMLALVQALPRLLVAVVVAVPLLAAAAPALAGGLPEIRTHEKNSVPTCVTPERLMDYLRLRNGKLDSRYEGIAHFYKKHGEAWRVRWDYAFFQMLLETNSLKYTGADKPRQNNFAGIGTTGGGVRGNSFPDVSTGVLAQVQHLVAYSGEKLTKADAVAQRTLENQDDIIARSLKLGRPMTFADLQMRWAVDRGYAHKIGVLADAFADAYCRGKEPEVAAKPDTQPTAKPEHKVLAVAAEEQKTLPATLKSPAVRYLPIPVLVHEGRAINLQAAQQ
ncbi:MAG: N-acetylmuramoyl-L-alanine amidase [Hyphomicrobiaceae bacterium]|nr:MAG: N-acetylmuramoyl-L-alanine amidase [Hyphomicrobiaceae bacterium]